MHRSSTNERIPLISQRHWVRRRTGSSRAATSIVEAPRAKMTICIHEWHWCDTLPATRDKQDPHWQQPSCYQANSRSHRHAVSRL